MEQKPNCPTSIATILACQKIARSFRENIFELSMIRNEWDPEFAISLNVWINDTIEKHFHNPMSYLKDEKYLTWHEIMMGSMRCFGILKASIKVDFKNDKAFQKELFQHLGYDDYFGDARNGDHVSVYNMLKTFKENLTDGLRIKMAKKADYTSIFNRIIGYANEISPFKDCFEKLESPAEMDKYGKKEVEEIYETIRDICIIATAYYQFEPNKRDEFNFFKVIRNL